MLRQAKKAPWALGREVSGEGEEKVILVLLERENESFTGVQGIGMSPFHWCQITVCNWDVYFNSQTFNINEC